MSKNSLLLLKFYNLFRVEVICLMVCHNQRLLKVLTVLTIRKMLIHGLVCANSIEFS